MKLQVVTLLILVIGLVYQVCGDETSNLKKIVSKTKAQIEELNRLLTKDLPDAERASLERKARILAKKLKYFSDTLDDKKTEEQKNIDIPSKKKNTRLLLAAVGAVASPVVSAVAVDAIKKTATLLTSGKLYSSVGNLAGKTAKAGFDIIGAASSVASSALNTLFPAEENGALASAVDNAANKAIKKLKNGEKYVKSSLRTIW